MELTNLLWERFVHRTDTFAVQRQSKDGDWRFRRAFAGFCRHQPKCKPKTCPDIEAIPLEREDMEKHLDGDKTIGVYQLNDDTVKWVCFDVDISKGVDIRESTWKNLRRQTTYLCDRLRELKVPHLVEFSGSKGMHVWVFFRTPVQAHKAFSFGGFVVSNVPVHPDLHIEVFPKQPRTANLGNLVKVPLGIHNKTGTRTQFVDKRFNSYADQVSVLRDVRMMSEKGLDAFLDHYEVESHGLTEWKTRSVDAGRGLPCYTNIMNTSVEEGVRDEVTFRLATFFKNHGVPENVAYGAIQAWNENNDPPLEDYLVEEKIESAYSRDYSHFPCMKKEFDKYCETSCMFYENKMKSREKMGVRS